MSTMMKSQPANCFWRERWPPCCSCANATSNPALDSTPITRTILVVSIFASTSLVVLAYSLLLLLPPFAPSLPLLPDDVAVLQGFQPYRQNRSIAKIDSRSRMQRVIESSSPKSISRSRARENRSSLRQNRDSS